MFQNRSSPAQEYWEHTKAYLGKTAEAAADRWEEGLNWSEAADALRHTVNRGKAFLGAAAPAQPDSPALADLLESDARRPAVDPFMDVGAAHHVHGRYDDGTAWPSLQQHLGGVLEAEAEASATVRPLEHFEIAGLGVAARNTKSAGAGALRFSTLDQIRRLDLLSAARQSASAAGATVDPMLAAVVLLSHQLDLQEAATAGSEEAADARLRFTLPSPEEFAANPDSLPDLASGWARAFPWALDGRGNLRVDGDHPQWKRALRRVLNLSQTELAELMPYARAVRENLGWQPRSVVETSWLLRPRLFGGPGQPSPLLAGDPKELRLRARPGDYASHETPADILADPERLRLYLEVRRELAWSPEWSGRPFQHPVWPAAVFGGAANGGEALKLQVRDPQPLDLIDPLGSKRIKYAPPQAFLVGGMISHRPSWERWVSGGVAWEQAAPPPNYPADAPAREYPADPLYTPLPGEAGIPGLPRFRSEDFDELSSYDWGRPPIQDDRFFLPTWVKYASIALPLVATVGILRAALPRIMRWRAKKASRQPWYPGGFESPMSKREAGLILNIKGAPTKERILERYRVLMRQNHPDLGGSPFISTKINEAKELLMKSGGYK